MLSERWSGGQAGGHKALAGGQILFESLLDSVPVDADEATSSALVAMSKALADLFSSEAAIDD
jgi:hypothetical protein